MSATNLPWLPTAPPDWIDRCKALAARLRDAGSAQADAQESIGTELRRLAGFDLPPGEQLRLQRLVGLACAATFTPPHFRRFRLGVVAARTLDFLVAALPAAAAARGLLVECIVAPYDAVASFAYGPANPFDGATVDAVLVVLDAQSFPDAGRLLDEAAELSHIEAAVALLSAMVDAVRRKAGCPAIVATIPQCGTRVGSADRSVSGTDARFATRVNDAILGGAHARRWIAWDMAALAADIGHASWFDPMRHHLAKVPFAIELAPRVASDLSALLAAMAGKSARAIVLDLDNTLWGGEIGDDGVDGIRLGQNSVDGEAYAAFQRFVLDLRERGIVVAVCSKNDDATAREPFRTHPEMALREDHIAVFQANWTDKATNLQTIADALNLGLESLVFIDDNPAERSRVRQELPLVNVPEIGDDPAYFVRRICYSGAFGQLPPTADDIGRADAYGADAKRAEVRATIGNYDDYLASLRMRMTLKPFDAAGNARIAQLVNKSNQFNLTTRRYNEEDVRRMASDPGLLCWQAALDDAFGAHGTIAIVVVRKAVDGWTIDTWLQSCRVLERGVEETLMNLLVAQARDAGIARLAGEYVPTARNSMVADFYPRLGFAECARGAGNGTRTFTLETSESAPRKSFIAVVRPDAD